MLMYAKPSLRDIARHLGRSANIVLREIW
ncbi:hypothetical protein [Vreelandella sp. H-I2]